MADGDYDDRVGEGHNDEGGFPSFCSAAGDNSRDTQKQDNGVTRGVDWNRDSVISSIVARMLKREKKKRGFIIAVCKYHGAGSKKTGQPASEHAQPTAECRIAPKNGKLIVQQK